jgi:hypothetical protein
VLNGLHTWRIHFMPPDHLLREVFETCKTFSEAKQHLEMTPIARPVIYTLIGCKPGERCVIERTEQSFKTRSDETAAANDWLRSIWPWEARVRVDLLFTRSYEETAANSRRRRESLAAWPGQFARASFDWVAAPVLNPYTRLAVEMCPAKGVLHAVGYENVAGRELPEPITLTCEIAAAAA